MIYGTLLPRHKVFIHPKYCRFAIFSFFHGAGLSKHRQPPLPVDGHLAAILRTGEELFKIADSRGFNRVLEDMLQRVFDSLGQPNDIFTLILVEEQRE